MERAQTFSVTPGEDGLQTRHIFNGYLKKC